MTKRKRLFTTLLMATTILAAMAQQKKITLKTDSPQANGEVMMYIQPLNAGAQDDAQKMVQTGTAFSADTETSSYGLYRVICIRNQTQTFLPIYIPEGENDNSIKLEITAKGPIAVEGNDNKALSAYATKVFDADQTLWTARNVGWQGYADMLGGYMTAADSILSLYACSSTVSQYIRLWACTSAYNAFSSLPNITKTKAFDIPLRLEDIIGEPSKTLDTPLASLFPTTSQLISSTMPRQATLTQKMETLFANYKCEEIRNTVANNMLQNFITKFNYQRDYESGLAELTALTEKYSLDGKYLKTFVSNRATIAGTPFPEGLTFVDKDGKQHSISELKGKYVYIDLWASWCVPCCKEVPHLQKLEAELANENVAFLSISIDKTAEPWLKKMNELQMHGNQWLDTGSKLANALNVRGIPFFVIYDKEGKLYKYNAPRPSSGEQLKSLLESLK